MVTNSNLICIDRTTPFDPSAFMGKGWSIEEQDERSLRITELDLNKVTFETMLRSGEVSIQSEEKIRRLKEVGHIRLDAKVLQTLWEEESLIPENWKTSDGGILFGGTILRNSDGDRCVLCLRWNGRVWDWFYSWLDVDWYAEDLSVCLAS